MFLLLKVFFMYDTLMIKSTQLLIFMGKKLVDLKSDCCKSKTDLRKTLSKDTPNS